MRLKDLMTSTVQTIAPDASLVDAAKQMRESDTGWLPVAVSGKIIGIITDRDIAIRAIAKGIDAHRTLVKEIMTPEVFACSPEASISDVCELMERQQVRRLVIQDADESLCGVVSLADVALQMRNSQSGDVLRKVSQPT
jgi:CBS domain-containing protein